MELKVVIGDDESGMRSLLGKAIEKAEGFELIGEGEDGEDVLSLVEMFHPQVVFLDVEMPKLSGIECAKKILDINPKIIIIFATAHEEYMSNAFELYAFDYLVKPFKMERIYQTLSRIKELNNCEAKLSIGTFAKNNNNMRKLLIKNKEGISFIDINDIILVQREERITQIYTEYTSYNTSESLNDLEKRLEGNAFFRSHKSYIINLSMINKVFPYGRWTYIIKFKGTVRDALITHEKYEELKKIFGLE